MALKDITLGQYYPGNSFLHRLDPRSKLFASLIFMTCLLLSQKVFLFLFLAGICALGFYLSEIPLGRILKNLKPFFWLFLITFLIHLFTKPRIVTANSLCSLFNNVSIGSFYRIKT